MEATRTQNQPVQPQLATRDSRRRWRQFKDRAARFTVLAGGISVIGALILIFVYLFYVVLPLFAPASIETHASYAMPSQGEPVYLSIEEQAEIGLALSDAGVLQFFDIDSGKALKSVALPAGQTGTAVTAVSEVNREKGLLAIATGDNDVWLVKHEYRIRFDGDDRSIEPVVTYPFGEKALALRERPVRLPVQPETAVLQSENRLNDETQALADEITDTLSNDGAVEPLTLPVVEAAPIVELEPLPPIKQLVVRENDGEIRIVALTEDGKLLRRDYGQAAGLFGGGDGSLEAGELQTLASSLKVKELILDPDAKNLYVIDGQGVTEVFGLSATGTEERETVNLLPPGKSLQQVAMLSGGSSLVAVGNDGVVRQWFPVRAEDNTVSLTEIRQFALGTNSQAMAIEVEQRRRGFLIGDQSGRLDVYYSTSERRVISEKVLDGPLQQIAIAPRANTVLATTGDQQLHVFKLHNEHPEVSWSALWGKVWYEGYSEADYIWQSSSASNDFEAKFSLTPLAFGTLKAAFYAMLIAVPLAIMGAVFTANFMAPRMRTMVKPTIEVMEALPTVILGFLAGLWLAPIAEENLPAALMLVPALIIGLILSAWVWSRLPGRIRYLVPEGWEAALLVPAVAIIVAFVFIISGPVENAFFGGDMPAWFDRELGIGYDQRNALVVGFAMGFAVIPTIFSISEDAIFSVPKHLSQGSLALGATPWQTLVRVVMPTASPGIFSGVMIGLGRAVGETMIVLMATGNTAIMDWSIFEGMRTLSANIAVEMPESEVASTHYRVLFLAGLVLFVFTFVFNTLAETVRQRLREKYSSI